MCVPRHRLGRNNRRRAPLRYSARVLQSNAKSDIAKRLACRSTSRRLSVEAQEFEDLKPDFDKMPPSFRTGKHYGEQISGDLATVFVKVKEGDGPDVPNGLLNPC